MERKLESLKSLIEIVERLRGPGGCPWDQKQTLRDMGRYLMEEVGEVGDALHEDGGQPSRHLCEELGDVLMNLFLAARIAEEADGFSLVEVADTISEKLVRRHPHVFGDAQVESVDEVLANWERIKATETQHHSESSPRPSTLDGVPRSLPPLTRSYELGKKAAKVGFDWANAQGALDKVREETEEVRAILGETQETPSDELVSELGDLLFAVVNLCRKSHVHPDDALRSTMTKFERRFRAVESRFSDMSGEPLERLESAWQQVKRGERQGDGIACGAPRQNSAKQRPSSKRSSPTSPEVEEES